jgi:hypothetical protein
MMQKFEQVNHYATVDRMDAVRYFTPVGEEVVWRIEDAEVPEDTVSTLILMCGELCQVLTLMLDYSLNY